MLLGDLSNLVLAGERIGFAFQGEFPGAVRIFGGAFEKGFKQGGLYHLNSFAENLIYYRFNRERGQVVSVNKLKVPQVVTYLRIKRGLT